MHPVAAFSYDGDGGGGGDPGTAVRLLAEQGLEVAAEERVTRTLLDTFDGRVHGAGLRLELRRSTATELVLTGKGAIPVRAQAAHVPRFATELPSGAFRARLAPVLDVRALLRRLTLSARESAASKRDRSGKAMVTVRVLHHLTVEGGEPAGGGEAVTAGEVGGAALPRWCVEVEELAGYPKPAARLRDALAELGLQRLLGDALDAAATATSIEAGGFSGSPTIDLDPRVPAIDGYAAVLAHLADAVDANWQGTIEDIDPEFLHDLRVALRRTRSVLGQARRVLPPNALDRYGNGFKRLAAATGPARDLDVNVMEWDSYVAPLAPESVASLGLVLDHLEKQRRAAHTSLAKTLRAASSRRLMASWHEWLTDPRSPPRSGGEANPDADRPLGPVVAERIAKAQERVLRRGRTIGPDSPAEALHDLRKDAKKLRYLLECFGGLLPAASRKAFVQRLKALQDNLGEHQDAEVHVTLLREISGELQTRVSADTLLAMGQLIEHLEQRRLAARDEFARRFAAYDTKRTYRALDDVLAGLVA